MLIWEFLYLQNSGLGMDSFMVGLRFMFYLCFYYVLFASMVSFMLFLYISFLIHLWFSLVYDGSLWFTCMFYK